MHPTISSTSRPNVSRQDQIPYSPEAMGQDIRRVRGAWEDSQSSRDRDAIYGYLDAVYALVTWWTVEGQETKWAHRALQMQGLAGSSREDAFAAIIRCTADPAKADKRTRSKWSRVMRYAAMHKSEPLDKFVRRKGGINACAVPFSRRLRRDAAKRLERRLARR